MSSLTEFFPHTHALGWTLINSLWQALIITGLVLILLRWIPTRFSQLRYSIACASLALIVLMSIGTFTYIEFNTPSEPIATHSFVFQNASLNLEKAQATGFTLQGLSEWVQAALQPNLSMILFVWCLGACLFMLRMMSGWWYISRLQAEAIPVTGEWNERLQALAKQLHIRQAVRLAQSARIHAPFVIGLIKPVVLIPVGMVSGLSTEQIETIFIHELAHIKRYDYLVNIIQSFVEALFFFNPFVWIISGIIRREREYCCDDTVLAKGNVVAYAHALARLEEERLSKAMFALALAENKNQLLNRIKRIMEKSAKNYSGKDKLIPALLLVVGLMCASWLTIQPARTHASQPVKTSTFAADTVKKPIVTKRSRTTIVTFDENGKPHEEVFESFEGDGNFDMAGMHFQFPMPQIPNIPPMQHFDMTISPMLAIPAMEPFNFSFGHTNLDTLSPGVFHFNSGDWEAFSREFEEKFRGHFGDFYEDHEKEMESMMKELEKNFEGRFNDLAFNVQMDMAGVEQLQEQIEEIEHSAHVWEDAARAQEEVLESQHEMLYERTREAQELTEEIVEGMDNRMEVFQGELKKLLAKDGYLQTQDEIKSIQWDDDGEIVINRKKIKESDRPKYNDLHRKYFMAGHLRYVD